MEKRKLPHGNELICPLGLGMGSLTEVSEDEIERIISDAIASGINYFDMCCGNAKIFAPFGRALKSHRQEVYLEVHFGAVYDEEGNYGWSRDLTKIKETFAFELQALQTDYVDFGFLHCVDEIEDYEKLVSSGVFDYIKELKEKGIVHHLGFSSHTPAVANKILDTGLMDMMLFSLNPAYDLEKGDEYGIGLIEERKELLKRAEKEGVGLSIMKPFHGGQLLDAERSPFKKAMTIPQCLSYALDRPGVLVACPGVRSYQDYLGIKHYLEASEEEKDYSSIVSEFTPVKARGNCVYCSHCQPCPVGIDIGLVNKYYDLARNGDILAKDHYRKLEVKATACVSCGHCNSRCPFAVDQVKRMQEIAEYFSSLE